MTIGPLQGIVSYPGLAWGNSFTRAEYVASHGITPGQCVIEMPQQNVQQLAQQGDVTFSYGQNSFTLYDCIVDQVNNGTSESGYIARVVILDRRWRWHPVKAGGYVNGHYNLPLPGGATNSGGFQDQLSFDQPTFRPGTQKAPQDMAILCLDAMGEQNYDVSAMPNDANPEVHWSYQNPAEALNQLCDQLGCRIVLNLEQNSVQIVNIGQGQALPVDGTIEFPSVGANPPEVPRSLLFVGGPTIFQDYLPLEAVGIDLDGTIRLMADLSFTPPNGWANEPLHWPNINSNNFPELDIARAKALATRWLYKLWRLKMPYTGAFLPGGETGTVTRVDQIHLYDRRIDSWTASDDPTQIIVAEPHLWGVFEPNYAQNYGKTAAGANSALPYLYSGNVTVDVDRSLVITETPLYYTDVNGMHPASDGNAAVNFGEGETTLVGLGIVTAFSIHDPQTWEPIRFTLERSLNPNAGGGPRVVRHDDVVRKLSIADGESNDQADELSQRANFYLDYAQSEYIQQNTLDVSYADLKLLQVDGLIHQITWSIECPSAGTKTRASLATEHNPYVPRYKTRRQIEKESRRPTSWQIMAQQWMKAGVYSGTFDL